MTLPFKDKEEAKEWGRNYYLIHKIKLNQYVRDWRATPRGRALKIIADAKRCAEKQKLDFDLTFNWAEKIILNGRCQLTGIKFDLKVDKRKIHNPLVSSIDRKNPKKGYTKKNCHIILWSINRAKNDMTMKEFKKFIKLIARKIN